MTYQRDTSGGRTLLDINISKWWTPCKCGYFVSSCCILVHLLSAVWWWRRGCVPWMQYPRRMVPFLLSTTLSLRKLFDICSGVQKWMPSGCPGVVTSNAGLILTMNLPSTYNIRYTNCPLWFPCPPKMSPFLFCSSLFFFIHCSRYEKKIDFSVRFLRAIYEFNMVHFLSKTEEPF